MKTLKIEKLAIALIIIYGLIFLIVITAMAWFSKTVFVEATPTNVGTSEAASLATSHADLSTDSYMGQTGLFVDKSASDYMFSCEFMVILSFSSSTDGYLTCLLDTINIEKTIGDVTTTTVLTDTQIYNNFTWRLYDEVYSDCSYCNAIGFSICSRCSDPCPTCNGSGFHDGVTCTTCSGVGTIGKNCNVCGGTGQVLDSVCSNCQGYKVAVAICRICGGNGLQGEGTCSNCNGAGYLTHLCQTCSGTGMVDTALCATCVGTGRCQSCSGTGRINCSYCGGTKRLKSVSEFANENGFLRETTKTTYNHLGDSLNTLTVNKLKKTSDYSVDSLTLRLKIFFLGEAAYSQVMTIQNRGGYTSTTTIPEKYLFEYSDEDYMFTVFKITLNYNLGELYKIMLNKGPGGEYADVKESGSNANIDEIPTTGGEKISFPVGDYMEAVYTRVNLDESSFYGDEIYYTPDLTVLPNGATIDRSPGIYYFLENGSGYTYREIKVGSFNEVRPTHAGYFRRALVYDPNAIYYSCDFDLKATVENGADVLVNKYLAGWKLQGTNTLINGSTDYYVDNPLTADTSITADIREKIHVNYYLNYGENTDIYHTMYVVPDHTVNFAYYYERQDLPVLPTRAGYQFAGWSSSMRASYSLLTNTWSNGLEYSYDSVIRTADAPDGVVNLYAIWSPIRQFKIYLNDYWGGNSLANAEYVIEADYDGSRVSCAIDNEPDLEIYIPVGKNLFDFFNNHVSGNKYQLVNGVKTGDPESINAGDWLIKDGNDYTYITGNTVASFDAENPVIIYAIWSRGFATKILMTSNERFKFKYSYETPGTPDPETGISTPVTTTTNTLSVTIQNRLTVNSIYYHDGYLNLPYAIEITQNNEAETLIGMCTKCFGVGVSETICSTCNGTGILRDICPTCGGDGKVQYPCTNTACENGRVTCTSCNGTGDDNSCRRCNKLGKVRCNRCDGLGSYYVGDQLVDCPICTDPENELYIGEVGYVKCGLCNGSGDDDFCDNCNGEGYFTCSVCQGVGYLERYCDDCEIIDGLNYTVFKEARICPDCNGATRFIGACSQCGGDGLDDSTKNYDSANSSGIRIALPEGLNLTQILNSNVFSIVRRGNASISPNTTQYNSDFVAILNSYDYYINATKAQNSNLNIGTFAFDTDEHTENGAMSAAIASQAPVYNTDNIAGGNPNDQEPTYYLWWK